MIVIVMTLLGVGILASDQVAKLGEFVWDFMIWSINVFVDGLLQLTPNWGPVGAHRMGRLNAYPASSRQHVRLVTTGELYQIEELAARLA